MRARLSVSVGLVLAASALAAPALAADYPVLRGTHAPKLPPPPVIESAPAADWNGFYFGGLAGYSTIERGTTRGPNALIAFNVRNTAEERDLALSQYPVVSGFGNRGTSFGAFAGYNLQFDDALVGVELDYMRLGRRGIGQDSLTRSGSVNGLGVTATVTGATAVRIDDLISFRARAGYVMGSVMFYATGGLAVGYGDVTHTASVLVNYADPTFTPYSSGLLTSNTRRGVFSGYTAGVGLEGMFGGLLLRGEYLYTRLVGPNSTTIDSNQARVGAGVKF
jgi:hypothetical protein